MNPLASSGADFEPDSEDPWAAGPVGPWGRDRWNRTLMPGMLLLRDDRKTDMKILENIEKHGKPRFSYFRKVLRPGKHPIGFPEPVGSILYEYEPEWSLMDLLRIHFHDFPPKSGILQCRQPLYLLYGDGISAI